MEKNWNKKIPVEKPPKRKKSPRSNTQKLVWLNLWYIDLFFCQLPNLKRLGYEKVGEIINSTMVCDFNNLFLNIYVKTILRQNKWKTANFWYLQNQHFDES